MHCTQRAHDSNGPTPDANCGRHASKHDQRSSDKGYPRSSQKVGMGQARHHSDATRLHGALRGRRQEGHMRGGDRDTGDSLLGRIVRAGGQRRARVHRQRRQPRSVAHRRPSKSMLRWSGASGTRRQSSDGVTTEQWELAADMNDEVAADVDGATRYAYRSKPQREWLAQSYDCPNASARGLKGTGRTCRSSDHRERTAATSLLCGNSAGVLFSGGRGLRSDRWGSPSGIPGGGTRGLRCMRCPEGAVEFSRTLRASFGRCTSQCLLLCRGPQEHDIERRQSERTSGPPRVA